MFINSDIWIVNIKNELISLGLIIITTNNFEIMRYRMENFGYLQTKFNAISFQFAKKFPLSTFDRPFLFKCNLYLNRQFNFIAKLI